MGMEFPNPVGLAAGFDKDGECIGGLFDLGFGFIELGTVTPLPQPGNPRPRLYRLAQWRAIINRMGFNNAGAHRLAENIRGSASQGIIGVSIGKNRDTAAMDAVNDYLLCLREVYPVASYVAVNISSPNTPGLRGLQQGAEAQKLLEVLRAEQQTLAAKHGRHVPLAVKIAPDLDPHQLDAIARTIIDHGIEGIVATNTTLSREGVEAHPLARESGGLSGAPLRPRATAIVKQLRETLGGQAAIIGVGGIMAGEDALERTRAGADLVQIYTGLIYRGPGLIREACRAFS
jgi:dihydroorotate dehydrogenase